MSVEFLNERRMSNYFIGILLAVAFASCESSECKKFKTGIFITKGDSLHLENKIIRTEEYQTVLNEELGFRDEYKIKWESDCEYYLVFQNSNRPELMQITHMDTIFVKITKVNPRSVRYKAKTSDREYEAEEFIAE